MDTSNNSDNAIRYGAIILAGGLSSRMQYPKPWLLTYEGISFAESIVNTYHAFGCQQIIFVINEAFAGPSFSEQINHIAQIATIVINKAPHRGRFYSLQLAVQHISSSDFVFIQNVDNPYVQSDLLIQLAKNKLHNTYTVPTFHSKGGHPILMSESIIQYIKTMKDTDGHLRSILQRFERVNTPVSCEEILLNINTQEAYDHYLTQASSTNTCHHAG